MILIDTSAWIEFLRKNGDPSAKEIISKLVAGNEAAFTCPVLFELLSGAASREMNFINDILSFCHHIVFHKQHWIKSAEIEKTLRESGVTVPRDDIFVATISVVENIPVICRDTHFDLISRTIPAHPAVTQI